ncbi:hypothetical protein D3C79_950490 [compost metagenome]
MARQQFRRGHHNARHLRQQHRNHRRIGHRTDVDRAVHAFGNEIRRMIVERPLYAGLTIALQVIAQRPNQLILAKGMRRAHPQNAHGFIAHAAQFVLHDLPVFNQLARMLITTLAVVRQLHGMGRTLD